MKNKYNSIRYILFSCLLLISCISNLFAQNNITVKGTITDEMNLPMVGVNISTVDGKTGTSATKTERLP